MSYEQAMKHSKNHRKDRFYQQCSGYGGDGESHQVSDKEIQDFSVSSFKKILEEARTAVFPIYIRQHGDGYYSIVDERNLFGHKVDSYENLIQFGIDYVGLHENDFRMMAKMAPFRQSSSLDERIADAGKKSAAIGDGIRVQDRGEIEI